MFLPFVTWPLLVQVRCEYSMVAFSTGERRRRGKSARRAMELSLVIRQTLEAAILTHLMPRSQVKSLAGFV
jgi:exosome complex component RRP41